MNTKTTNDLDRMIDEALSAEESELMRQIGEEPNYVTQAFGIFSGRLGWVHTVMMIAQTVLFVIGVWLAWRFFNTNDPMEAIHLGFPSAVLIIMGGMMKLSLWPSIQTNRVLREMKRLELQIARGRQ